MRIRSIKPEFWRDEAIVALPISARLTFVGMWSYVDDNGVGSARLSSIIGDLYSEDMARDPQETLRRVSGDLQQLENAGMLIRYTDPGNGQRELLYVAKWTKHQIVNRPSKGNQYPLPSAETVEAQDTLRSASRGSQETLSAGAGEQGSRGAGEQLEKTCSPASPPSVIEPDRFDEFYSIYPRKVGKGNAKTAFVKAAKKVGAQTVIDGAHQLATDPNLPEKHLIPHPATWLNRDGWEDEPHPARSSHRPDAHVMTSREQTWMQAELMKDNPDPRAIQLSGGTPQLRMLG